MEELALLLGQARRPADPEAGVANSPFTLVVGLYFRLNYTFEGAPQLFNGNGFSRPIRFYLNFVAAFALPTS
jgi:hypothetical protein